jgi:hypothetical protein
MKLLTATLFLAISLAQCVSAQSKTQPANSSQSTVGKQEKKEQKATAQAQKQTAKGQTSDKGKKTSSAQDAAYAAAYKAGIPK